MKKLNLRFRLTIGIIFLCAGLFINYSLLSNRTDNSQPVIPSVKDVPKAVMSANTETPVEAVISGNPNRIELPSVSVDLPVIKGYYNYQKQVWTLTGDKAQFATLTNEPNNREGITFIYGHNNKKVFGRLTTIAAGQKAYIYTDNNHKFVYQFRSSVTTKPEDSSMLDYHGKPILVVQTCTGMFYQNRTHYIFDLVDAS